MENQSFFISNYYQVYYCREKFAKIANLFLNIGAFTRIEALKHLKVLDIQSKSMSNTTIFAKGGSRIIFLAAQLYAASIFGIIYANGYFHCHLK